MTDESITNDKSLSEEVKLRKDQVFKARLESFIKSKGMSIPQFNKAIGISRQRWYYYSWNLWPIPDWLQIKMAQVLQVDSRVIFPEPKKEAGSAITSNESPSNSNNPEEEVKNEN